MKILICGKGGSGKSTIAALLAKSMAKEDIEFFTPCKVRTHEGTKKR